MIFPTLGTLIGETERALALEDEQFVVPEELKDYANDGQQEAESLIITVDPDYFLTRATITLVAGQEGYDLPSNCFALKIRGIIYKNGTNVFEIKRIRNWKKFLEYSLNTTVTSSSGTEYKYLIENSAPGEQQIIFSPTPQESGALATVWHVRNVRVMEEDSDPCDIPEYSSFIVEYMKMRCYEKEGHPNYQACKIRVDEKRELMINTLANMVEDGDNELEPDFRGYQDQVGA